MIASTESPIGTADFDATLATFHHAYPAFDTTHVLDELRAREYARLDEQGHIYLDYTGGGLYAVSQLEDHMALLCSHVFGNPHSRNPTSQAMIDLVEQAHSRVLAYFGASPDEYVAIFRMPVAHSSWSVRPIPLQPVADTCSAPTTITRSTASASSPGPRVLR